MRFGHRLHDYAAFDPVLQQPLLEQIGSSFFTGPLSFVGEAYVSARVIAAILATFFINLLIGSFGTICSP